MPWKRIVTQDESDSSSSDEPHAKRLRTAWKQYLTSRRLQKSNHDGQGTSTTAQDLTLLSVYPNPSDVLLHHDYVGTTRSGPSTSSQCQSFHSSMPISDIHSFSQKLMENFRLYSERCFTPLVADTPADLSFKGPQPINPGDEEEPEDVPELEDDPDRLNVSFSPTLHLPSVEKIKTENTVIESVLRSPHILNTQDTDSCQVEASTSLASDINTVNELGTSEVNNETDATVIAVESPLSKTDINGAVQPNTSSRKQATNDDVNSNLNEVLLGVLECPVCWEVMSPPIYQCLRGHLLCKPCKKRLSTCPTCRANFNIHRNLAMEKVADKLKYPCKNSGSGCTVLVLLREKREHEANCPHRLYSCLSPFCAPRWTCKLTQLPNHYESLHSQMLLRGPKHLLKITHDFLRKPASLDWIILAFEQLFRVNIHLVPPGDVYGCVQYIGPYSSSKKYIYELKTELLLDTYRCLTFERVTHSDLTKIERNYVKKDSFYLPDSWTKNFKSDEFPKQITRLEISVNVKPA